MALNAFYTDETEIPSGMEEHYAEKDGKFFLQVTPVGSWGLEDTSSLKQALQTERRNYADAKKSLKAFDGLDPEQARLALEQIDDLKEQAEGNEDQEKALKVLEQQLVQKYDGERNKLVKKHESEIQASNDRSERLWNKLQSTMIVGDAAKAIAENGGSVDLLMPHIMQVAKVVETSDGSDYTVEIMDDSGSARISMQPGSTEPMHLSEYVSDVLRPSKAFARAFDSSGAEGSAATPSGNRAASGAMLKTLDDQRNVQKYRAAREKAIEQGRPVDSILPEYQ